MLLRSLIGLLGLCLFVNGLTARDLYVNPATGSDSANGLAPAPSGANGPVKTITRGLKLAQAGDTVHLAPVTYRESATFHNRSGEPDRPITLDGHGATLDGAEPLRPQDWESLGNGLYRNGHLVHLNAAMRDRWFFLFDGKMVHMGRTSKGPKQPLKTPEQLAPGEWTFVANEAQPKPGELAGAFYVRIKSDATLADAHIAAPLRLNGVGLGGTNAYLVIRNLTATHVSNDGFNLHGRSHHIRLENVTSIECGDDGFSAHEECQAEVHGFTSIGNSTGICDIGHSDTSFDHVFIRDCLGYDLYFLETGRHRVSNAFILSSAARSIYVQSNQSAEADCSLNLENVVVKRFGKPNEIHVSTHTILEASKLTTTGLSILSSGGHIRLFDSVISGGKSVIVNLARGTQWEGDRNRYDIARWTLDKTSYKIADFGKLQSQLQQESHSQWENLPLENGLPSGTKLPVGFSENGRAP